MTSPGMGTIVPLLSAAPTASAVVGLATLDAFDRGTGGAVMLHGVDDATREAVLAELVARGWRRNDHPDNHDARGAVRGGFYVTMWGPRHA